LLPDDHHGWFPQRRKTQIKTFYGKTQKEVKAKAKGYRGAKDSGLLVDVNYLFPEWANIWYELWYVKFRGKQVFRDFLKKCNRMDKNGRFQMKKDLKSKDFRSFWWR